MSNERPDWLASEEYQKYKKVDKITVDAEFNVIVCHKCNKLLANVFIAKDDALMYINGPFWTFCNECFDSDTGCLRYQPERL